MKKYLLISVFFCALVITRGALIYSFNNNLSWLSDEERNYEIAKNYLNGKGFTVYDNDSKTYKLTAYHPSFSVFVYIFMLKNNISKNSWTMFCYSLFIALHLLSAVYFFKLAQIFIKNKILTNFATIAYGFYPSVIFYIGSLFLYENMVTPLLVIVTYKILRITCFNQDIKIADYFIILLSFMFSALFRPSSITVYVLILAVSLFFMAKDRLKLKINNTHKIALILSIYLFVFIAHIPILIKNYNMFGHYVLTTQQNFLFLEGHNPYARGSWAGKPSKSFVTYIHENIPDFESLNEYQQGAAYKKLAASWILNNPVKEMTLLFRKAAIYFLPQNFDSELPGNRLWNPVNLAAHSLFLLYLCGFLLKKKFPFRIEILLLVPIFASLAFSLAMFVGYRWRYYAEPFMLLAAFIFLERFIFPGRRPGTIVVKP
ncbi:MAG: hypothetical protein FJZ11_00540 [Candidatus Omnitrophica bacterium]|nr:hypothetical protein [Candidatus Omnitrophota bacterium]